MKRRFGLKKRATAAVMLFALSSSAIAQAPLEANAVAASTLTWHPPALTSPTVISITQANRDLNLRTDRDYVLKMPAVAITGMNGLRVNGGRNVVLIGGAISVSDVPWGTSGDDRRGLVLKNQTGTVHIEGLQISGKDLAEGIQIAAPAAVVQLQNIRITRVSAGSDTSFHSDVLQVWGGVRALRVDGLTGSTEFQGIFLKSDVAGAPIGSVDLRRINIIGGGWAAGYLFYANSAVGSVTTSNVFGVPGENKEWQYSVFPHLPLTVWKGVVDGSPYSGDFVPAGSVGPNYRR